MKHNFIKLTALKGNLTLIDINIINAFIETKKSPNNPTEIAFKDIWKNKNANNMLVKESISEIYDQLNEKEN